MAPFSKPETVLKQAEGLVSVGQTHAALQSLTEMFASKRFRSTPLASLEPIMYRFIELCVDMRKGRTAKEGLMQYKNIAQNSSVQSIESVITKFVQLADAKVREAQEKAAVKVAVDVDDLEASETPESILLGAVSGDQSKDRTDRALVTPWLKFLWESYRTSLETLKNNARLEDIYQKIAQQAFKFCLKHQRKVEFRRLCETLRLHLSNVAKYSHQPHSINLSDPDTLQRHLDTRFAQLNASVELELWQEAFRSVEDVHNLLTMAKKAPRPAMMANYYEKLTKIFLMSGNALFHAAAWGRYYSIVTSIGGKSEEELSRLAGQVLISALAVPVGMATEDVDGPKGRNARLAALLGLTKTPTRDGLLRDALSRGALKISPASVKSLYDILEVTFDPLSLCCSIAPLMRTLADEASSYQQYRALLQRAILSRLLSQLSQVYSSIKISNLYDLVTPLKDSEGAYTEVQVEAYVMGCARRGELNIHVDHATGSITFIDDPFVSSDELRTHIVSDEERVQKSSSDIARTRLSKLATCLHNSLTRIDPPPMSRSLPQEEQGEKFKSLVAAAEAERKGLQVRRALAARRRELLSELTVRKEKEETSRRAEQNRKEKEEESKRQVEDLKRREQERLRKEVNNVRIEEAKKLAQKLTASGLKGLPLDDMENLNTDTLLSLQVEQLEKEKKESVERLRIIAKRIDHVERAYRQEERPLLAKDYEQQQIVDRKTFDTNRKFRVEGAHQKHQEDMESKERLARMMADYLVRREQIVTARGEDFAKKQDLSRKKIEDEKTKRRNAVLKEREEERAKLEEEERILREKQEEEDRLEAEKRAEEDKKRMEEEAVLAAEEAKKREEEEKAAAIRKEREERRAAEVEQVRLKAQREEEAAENARQRASESKFSKSPSTPSVLSRSTNGDDWRRSTPAGTPATPARASSTLVQSGTPGVSSPAKYRPPGAMGGGTGGGGATGTFQSTLRGARESGKEAPRQSGAGPGGGASAPSREFPRPSTPSRGAGEPAKDDDGFQKVPEKPQAWRSSRRGRA